MRTLAPGGRKPRLGYRRTLGWYSEKQIHCHEERDCSPDAQDDEGALQSAILLDVDPALRRTRLAGNRKGVESRLSADVG